MSRIILHTELNPENNAMLQALYSRSIDSVTDHIEKLEKVGSSKFMSQYYLGYGHASIGDCGSETMYFEGISMLAAKAIEDNPLFVGQECSSRYIDFSHQPFHDPMEKNSEASGIVANLYTQYRKFYVESLEPLKDALRVRFPIAEGDKPVVYEKAIAARAFDILRGFLPASATTNVAWTGRLSNAGEHLIWMMHHPLQEVRDLGIKAYSQLHDKYPNSFHLTYSLLDDALDWGHDIEEALIEIEGKDMYEHMSHPDNFYASYLPSQNVLVEEKGFFGADVEVLGYPVDFESDEVLSARPKRSKLHKHGPSSQVTLKINAGLDFGSFRDIQRHRNGYCSMPLISGANGIHPWYVENLTEELQKKAIDLLGKVKEAYFKLLRSEGKFDTDRESSESLGRLQYLLPMGTAVEVELQYTVQQAVYVAELRSGKTVHATARPFAQDLGKFLVENGVPCFYDTELDDWTVRRGEQDIVAK